MFMDPGDEVITKPVVIAYYMYVCEGISADSFKKYLPQSSLF